MISGNSAPDGSNVYMTDYVPALRVTGELDQDCRIGVTIDRKGDFADGLFTNGLPGRGTAANFFSDDSNFTVSIHDDGEAYLDGAVTVTFDSDGGSEVEAQTLVTGRKAVRPEDPAKDGFTFKDWYRVTDADAGTLDDTAFDFENTAVSESITLKAVWEEISEDTVIIKSANVEFRGKILLKFAFSFPESVLDDEGAYVTFEKAGTTTKKLVSEGTADADAVSFIIPVPAPEYADDIIVRAFDGEDSRLTLKSANGTDTYTVTASALSYGYTSVKNGNVERQNLGKALYLYNRAADAMFGS